MTDTATTPETAPSVPVAPESVTVPVPNATAPEPAPQTKAESEPTPPASDEGDKSKEPAKRPASERISQLYAQKQQAVAEAQAARQEVERLHAELAKLRETPLDQLPYEQQEAARLRSVVKAERLDEQVSAAQQAAQRAHQARLASFEAKVEAVRERIPDFHQVFANTPVSDAMADVIAESDRAAEIAYYLGSNKQEAAEIYRLPPHLQGARLAQIEAKVSVPARKTSNAPPPVPSVSAVAAGSVAKDPANMSMSEFAEYLNKQMKRA